MIERIQKDGEELVILIRSQFSPEKTTFLTHPELKQQVGLVVYAAGTEIPRHVHRSIERRIVGTSEVIVVKSGRCLLDVYSNEGDLVTTCELLPGDLMLMIGGGHGFRMLEDTVLLEVKQGPYTGIDEKELF